MDVSSDCGGTERGTFHVVVSGDVASFLAKYGDRAARTNLCKSREVVSVVKVMSEVCGDVRLSNDVRWEARGCNGSLDLE